MLKELMIELLTTLLKYTKKEVYQNKEKKERIFFIV
jgi:hypothetical protein